MLNNEMKPRSFKDAAYGAFAGVAKALSGARRLELLDLLVQGPRSVEGLATAAGLSFASASQHLQVLRRARVVETTRRGTTVEYRLAPGVAEVFAALRALAELRSLELGEAKASFYGAAGAAEAIEIDELRGRLASGTATLLDVRPAAEFAAGHIAGALSLPIEELAARLDELPSDRLLVATCRGPYCVFAADAVRMLRAAGREAVRFEPGVADWAALGGPVESGA